MFIGIHFIWFGDKLKASEMVALERSFTVFVLLYFREKYIYISKNFHNHKKGLSPFEQNIIDCIRSFINQQAWKIYRSILELYNYFFHCWISS